jgi:drug/metabolite transporter (DMT)-like permease
MNVVVWLILCLIWGTTWIFIKIGLHDLPPMTFAASRFILSAAILTPLIYIKRSQLPRTSREWKLIALTGILQFSVNYSTVFWSELYISSGLAAVLQAMITVFGLVLAWIFLPNEKITTRKIIAVTVGIVGVAVIFVEQLAVNNSMAFWGCVAIVAGSYAAAQASILVKAKGGAIPPAILLWGQMLCGLPAVLIYAFVKEGDPTAFVWSWTAIVCVLYLSIAGTVTAFWLYYWLLIRIESTRAMMISLVTPLIAVIVGALVLGETLPPQTFAGGLLILISIGLIVFRRRAKIAAVE